MNITKDNWTLQHKEIDNLVDSLHLIRENKDWTKSFFSIVPYRLDGKEYKMYPRPIWYTRKDLEQILEEQIVLHIKK